MKYPVTKTVAAAALLMLTTSAASAASFTLFTDRASFDAAAANIVVEDFNGDREEFSGNSVGNVVGNRTTMDVVGPADSSFIGLTGDGDLELDVDGLHSDQAQFKFNTGSIFGFALDMIQDNNRTPAFDMEEIAFSFGGSQWLLTDVLGLTDSPNATAEIPVTRGGPVFAGILSDTAFDNFTILSGELVAPFGVDGASENVYIDSLVLATAAPSQVPLPAGLPLLLVGLGAFGVMRRRA